MEHVPSELLVAHLERFLTAQAPRPRRILRLDRRFSDYSSSCALEELDVTLDDGALLELVLKHLHPACLLPDARRSRPHFMYDPRREIEVYKHILAPTHVGAAAFYGGYSHDSGRQHMIFLERVPSAKLCHVGDFQVWMEAARWLARFHARFATRARALSRRTRLLRHDRAYYRLWMRRAQASDLATSARGENRQVLEQLAQKYELAIGRVCQLPRVVIHGESYASNILIRNSPLLATAVCPIDWELSALGTGLMDLAALVAGSWDDEHRIAMADAYYVAAVEQGQRMAPWGQFLSLLDCCLLLQAIQWAGWASEWKPPADQTRDWFGEAARLSEKIAP